MLTYCKKRSQNNSTELSAGRKEKHAMSTARGECGATAMFNTSSFLEHFSHFYNLKGMSNYLGKNTISILQHIDVLHFTRSKQMTHCTLQLPNIDNNVLIQLFFFDR